MIKFEETPVFAQYDNAVEMVEYGLDIATSDELSGKFMLGYNCEYSLIMDIDSATLEIADPYNDYDGELISYTDEIFDDAEESILATRSFDVFSDLMRYLAKNKDEVIYIETESYILLLSLNYTLEIAYRVR